MPMCVTMKIMSMEGADLVVASSGNGCHPQGKASLHIFSAPEEASLCVMCSEEVSLMETGLLLCPPFHSLPSIISCQSQL